LCPSRDSPAGSNLESLGATYSFNCISSLKVYILLFNTCAKVHVISARIAEISAKVTRGRYLLCSSYISDQRYDMTTVDHRGSVTEISPILSRQMYPPIYQTKVVFVERALHAV